LTARGAALRALLRGGDSSFDLDVELKLAKLSARDAAFATELVYGTLKMQRALAWSVQTALRRPLESLDPPLRWVLLLGAYQLLYLDRVPAHGAVDESVKLARAHGHEGTAGLANAALRKLATERSRPPAPTISDPPSALGIYASLPDWIAAHFIARFGFDDAVRAAEGQNGAPRRAVRLAAGQGPPPGAKSGRYGVPETAIVESLTGADRYFLCADFASYVETQERAAKMWQSREDWTRMSILNVARSGWFSADRTVLEYARDIWGVDPVSVTLDEE